MGNVLSFLVTYLRTKQHKGEVILRIEDLDPQRCKPEYSDQILRDIELFGFSFSGPVLYQSKRTDVYRSYYEQLQARDLVYPCFCSRADLHSASAPHLGEEYLYSGACRELNAAEVLQQSKTRNPAYRVKITDSYSDTFIDELQGKQTFRLLAGQGDFIVLRSDGVFAYQLAVTVDDALSGVTEVTRGVDLLTSSHKQRYLQDTLDLPTVSYAHIPLLIDEEGRRLSKRNQDSTLSFLLNELHWSPQQILGHLAYISGMIDQPAALSADELVSCANLDALKEKRAITWRV